MQYVTIVNKHLQNQCTTTIKGLILGGCGLFCIGGLRGGLRVKGLINKPVCRAFYYILWPLRISFPVLFVCGLSADHWWIQAGFC